MSTITAQFLDRPIFRIVSEIADARGVRAFVIGGFVRDCFLGRPRSDIDIVVEGSGIDFARAVGERTHQHVSYFKNFGTAMLHFQDDEVEFVGARKESYNRDSRKPVVEDGTLEEDQLRRDFTINAMAFSLCKEDYGALIDPFGGREDLAAGVIRCVGDPTKRFSEDALRILRALRFSAKLGFRIDTDTQDAMRDLSEKLSDIAAERVKTELEGMLTGPHVLPVLLDHPDILGVPIPEILPCVGFDQLNPYHIYDVWEHIAHSVDNIAPEPLLRWAMLMHDLGKPPCFSEEGNGTLGHFYGHGRVSAVLADGIMDRLRFSNEEKAIIHELVENHDRFIKPTARAVRRELNRIGQEQCERSVRVWIADIEAQNPQYGPPRLKEIEYLRQLARDILAAEECVSLKTLAIHGGDLIALGYAPGPALGRELDKLLSVVLDDPAKNNRAILLDIAAQDR